MSDTPAIETVAANPLDDQAAFDAAFAEFSSADAPAVELPVDPQLAAADAELDAEAKAKAEAELDEWDLTPADDAAAEQAAKAADADAAAAAAAAVTANDDDDDVEQARKELEQKLRSAQGRLVKNPDNEKLAQQVVQLTEALSRLDDPAQLAADESAAAATASAPTAAIPPGFTEQEWALFQQDFPDDARELAAAAAQDAPANAAPQAQQQAPSTELTPEEQARSRALFLQPIVAAHPDYPEIVSKANWPAFEAYIAAITDPIKRLGAQCVVESGTAAEVIALVSEFKASKKPKAAGLAVQTRSTQPKPTLGASSKDDYDAGWNL